MLIEKLIRNGYFPKELPPFFTTEKLALNLDALERSFLSYSNLPSSSKSIIFSIPNSKTKRRNISIPNPYHQIKLCQNISENWTELTDFFKTSKLSLTIPSEDQTFSRAIIPQNPFSEVTKQRVIKSTASRYLLKTDISRYYSTIYTHSISWALHGKEAAKLKKNDKNLLGNTLDFYVRNTKEQQTLGIPVGPDTSLIIAEILGTRIDLMIEEKISNVKGFRYIDDIYLYFKNLGEAEKAKYIITSIFSEFELEMNSDKTEIIELHNEVEPEWISELRLYEIKKDSEKDIISYFSKVFKFNELYPTESIMKYAIKKVSNIEIDNTVWDVFEAFLLKAILTDGSCIEDVINIYTKFYSKKYPVNFTTLEDTINYCIEYNCNYFNSYEILWCLWTCIIFDLNLQENVQKLIFSYDDPLIALMVLYLQSIDKVDRNYDTRLWKNHMKSEELFSNYWILAYEASYQNWLDTKSGKDYINGNMFFNDLRAKNIGFVLDHNIIQTNYKLRDNDKQLQPILNHTEILVTDWY